MNESLAVWQREIAVGLEAQHRPGTLIDKRPRHEARGTAQHHLHESTGQRMSGIERAEFARWRVEATEATTIHMIGY
ncbi:MAG: hypothetical protein E5X67_06280 [Mesorhizobium sp.]|uniref:hypothetical protein n=1 Tax=Mesorhizobium sp. TaxID=1871066 RepID=UPI001209F492|nr:hypothetical protein [Mesorhizobium sp.]TIP29640.1 MAG: hypothetical protein E5X67_06280 [Mesorhizobium sp.]